MGPGIPLYAFGPFLLDTRERRLLRDGEVVPRTLKAFELLQVLVENQGHLLQKEELLRRVWPDAIVEENNLTVTISALRKALGEGPTDRQYIETVPRRGYRFVADLRASAESTEAARSPQERRARAFALRAMVLAAAAALAWVWKRSTPAAIAVPVRSMAVLPFRSLTNDGEYLGLGMADALITRLGRTKLLLVRSTGTVQKYTVPGLDPVAAGRDLQVDSVLEGSIQTAGDRLRTTVRLLRVSDGSTLWAGTFDERLTDIFSVQDQVSQRVAGALALELTEAQRSLLTRRDTKRVGHAAMVAFLRLNGRRLEATVDEAEQAILQVASGVLARNGLQDWIQAHEVPA
jgi:DNA-binding winged helix-turn-helix (wHTH) protein